MPLSAKSTPLVRAIGRWSLFTLVLNLIIGSGVFKLPTDISALLGWWAPVAYIVAAAGIGAIMAATAEVASQFDQAGGPYLYAREAFGRFAGVEIGWLAWLVRLTGSAANANVFLLYMAQFWKPAGGGAARLLVLTLIIGGIAAINIRGVGGGAQLSNFFAAAKLVPLLLFIGVGVFFLAAHNGGSAQLPHGTAPAVKWDEAILLLVFAFGGFEGALMAQGETKNSRRDVPFALFTALAAAASIYLLNQIVAQAVLPSGSLSPRPLADAAGIIAGPRAAAFMALGALISVGGNITSSVLNTPRLIFALADGGDFPRFLTAVHPRFRTPWLAIVIYSSLVWALAAVNDFRWNASLSAVGRLFIYSAICIALPVLRRRQPDRPAFRMKGGLIFAGIGLLFCVAMIFRLGRTEIAIIAGVSAVAVANWLWGRRKPYRR